MQNPLDHPLTIVKGLVGYAQQDTTLIDFMDANTSNYLTHGTSETLKKLYCLNLTKQQEHE